MIKVSIIVVLYDEYNLVMDCLKSLYNSNVNDNEIILVHNNSGKEGVDKVLERFNVIYIKNNTNLGFGQAANVGLRKAKGEYLLVLTPDTILLKNTLKKTLDYIHNYKYVGLLGCRVYAKPKIFQGSAFYEFPNIISHLYEYNVLFYKLILKLKKNFIPTMYSLQAHKKEILAKHIGGGYMLFRKKALVSIGGFSKRYFMYREETDVCKRLYEKGWKIVYIPKGGVIHSGEGTTRIRITQSSPHYLKSTYIFFKTYYGLIYALFAWIVGIVSVGISILILAGTTIFKKTLNKQSQSALLLPYWITIFKWHLLKGLGVVFAKEDEK